MRATDKTVVTFRERPAGQPEALRAWFYPGRNWGEEFVYPKAKAIELAKTTNVPVLFTPAEMPMEVTKPIQSVDEPVVVELKRAPIMAIKPTGEEVQLAEVVTPPPPAAGMAWPPRLRLRLGLPRAHRMKRSRCCRPASNLPLMGLLGLAMLGGAFALRAASKRI
ncbi:MAG: hypothetical protein IPJ98_21675 [Bryobacterales bacterium]|nr:hypothetical protein [Bryobacterales bacterium]